MRIIIASWFLIFVALAPNAFAADTGPCKGGINGSCWNNQSFDGKVNLIAGFLQGQRAENMQAGLAGRSYRNIWEEDYYSLPSETTFGDVLDYIDKLYSFPINREIEFYKAMLLAGIYLKDDDSNDRMQLLKLFREGKNLPTDGKIMKIKAANIVRISSKQGDFDVLLPRVTLEGVSNEKQATAMNLIRFLTENLGWGSDCSKGPASIGLSYPLDLFSEDGLLRAEVRMYGAYICKNGKSIRINAFAGRDEINLSTLLLDNGFVKFDAKNDPKWPSNKNFSMALPYSRDNGTRFIANEPVYGLVKYILKDTSF
ncbi:hypothetical protein [Sneathiella aquimaris]|uniref:hypothetical protein n=1 Tax=Sneathiella aquimaris TaxID=2599305 RepID=UPI00146AAB5B|nr:hypothetical protein [Sneathiella aquimaris]